ncbi:MAG: hypothetical protein EZS28_010771 [Streblomastix strix]|uniref:Uncharacterized protein n=1 Tax=Streblomastix strix TaxID=222440 RepID=A0A5J4WFD7_9EUKA|nr:MAG: hypothetical protein EZS28_010771 [Streblomastix strix]
MCFGEKHAPLMFNMTLKPIMKLIRERLQIRSESQGSIDNQHTKTVWLEALGKEVNTRNIANNRISLLGEMVSNRSDSNERGQKIEVVVEDNRRIKIAQKQTLAKIKTLASFIRKLNFLRRQIRRGGMHMRRLNKAKSWSALKKRLNNKLNINQSILQEIYCWQKKTEENKPIRAIIHWPQAILTTDASAISWGATLKLQNPEKEIWFQGDWSDKWKLSSSNQRETAAVLCALMRSEHFLRRQRVTALKIETDNSVTSFNLNWLQQHYHFRSIQIKSLRNGELRAANPIISYLRDREYDSRFSFQVSNVWGLFTPKRSSTRGVELVLGETNNKQFQQQKELQIQAICECDTRMLAVAQDHLSKFWRSEVSYLHPPFPLIPATHSKLKREAVQAF